MKIEIPKSYQPYIDSTVVRASSLFPDLKISADSLVISIDANEKDYDKDQLREEIFSILYRERIFEETKSVRNWLYSNNE